LISLLKHHSEQLTPPANDGILGGMDAYSLDLRERIVAALDQGQTQKAVAERFAVSRSSVQRYARRQRQGRSLRREPIPGRPPKLRTDEHDALLRALLASVPDRDRTTGALARAWQEETGQTISQPTIWRRLKALGLSVKKSAASPPSETRRSAPPGGKP
jgi:transposase